MSAPSTEDLFYYLPLSVWTAEMFALQDEVNRLATIASSSSCSEEYYDKYKERSKRLDDLKRECLCSPKNHGAALASWQAARSRWG